MPKIAMVNGTFTTYPSVGTALCAGSRFTVTSEFKDFDVPAYHSSHGANIEYDHAFQARSAGVIYTFAVMKGDLNQRADIGTKCAIAINPSEKSGHIAVLGPVTPVIPNDGLTFTVTKTSSENPDFSFTGSLCFAAGTGLRAKGGFRRVETLNVGDLVWTERGKFEPIAWAGERLTVATGPKAPVNLQGRGFGAGRSLILSPQHRVLLSGNALEQVTGKSEALVKACDLAKHALAQRDCGGLVSYHHILLERHALVQTHSGHWAETLYPDIKALSTLDDDAFDEITELFPQLRSERGCNWKLSRPFLEEDEISAYARHISHNDGVGHVTDLP